MDVNFEYIAAGSVEPVVFEKVLGEKSGGGLVDNPAYDIPTGTAVGLSGADLKPIKAYRLVKVVAAIDTAIEIAKGSGIVIGDIITHAGIGVACTDLDDADATKDVVTVTLGQAIPTDTVLYQGDVVAVEGVEEVKYGYYDAIQTTPNALLIVAANPNAGEVAIATVLPFYQGNEEIVAGQYVVLNAKVDAVAAVVTTPKYIPKYLTGAPVYAGKGDQAVKLVVAAVVRKETVNASLEVLALLPTINIV